MSGQRYYWIKLRRDFFDSPEIDWLQDQKKGSDYVILYEKLCILTANNGGELSRKVGEMVIAYDVKKLAALTKFDFDTVAVALELYKKIGLIYQNKNGILVIANIDKMVGSESESAARVRKLRSRQKALHCNADVTKNVTSCVTADIRDIEIRDKCVSSVKDTHCPVAPDTPHPKSENLNEKAKDIIDYLNAKLGTKYKASNRKTLALIKARMSEGFTVEDFKTVIDKKTLEWAQEANMCQYLRPVTLFSNKFESYLNQPSQAKNTVNKFANFEQRDWDWKKIDEILAND